MSKIKLFVKFGEKEHMKRLAEGNVYFSHAKKFIDIEKEENLKGQGDQSEGRLKINAIKLQMFDPLTNRLIGEREGTIVDMCTQNINTMPVFCLTAIVDDDCVNVKDDSFDIFLGRDIYNDIRSHFPKADTALLIFEPYKFIQEINNRFDNNIRHDLIKYFNMNIITIDFLMYLQGSKENNKEIKFTLNTQNEYKMLFCKDLFFAKEKEYRFVYPFPVLDKPKEFIVNSNFNSQIMELEDFFKGVRVCQKSAFSIA